MSRCQATLSLTVPGRACRGGDVVYGSDMKDYGLYRNFQLDSLGCLRNISAETRYTIMS